MKAVMYGAGNIGRGFIAQKFSLAGYDVVFVDVNSEIVDNINEQKRYPLTIVCNEPYDIYVENVSAVNGINKDLVIEQIVTADIMATSIGANILPLIAPIVAQALEKRWAQNPDSKLDILLCENLNHADKIFRELLEKNISANYLDKLAANLGLIETSIGRMVPIMTEEMQKGNPLRVCVEEYDFLPIDKDAFVNEVLTGPNIVPYSPFSFFIQRKLFLHNMGHAMTAYMGDLMGYEYIADAIGDPFIKYFVKSAMQQSATALHIKYNVKITELFDHVDDLLYRFSNKALKDSIGRVGRDPIRKVAANDRFSGAIDFCCEEGIYPIHIALGLAYALNNLKQSSADFALDQLLSEHVKLNPALTNQVKEFISLIEAKADFKAVNAYIELCQRKVRGSIV